MAWECGRPLTYADIAAAYHAEAAEEGVGKYDDDPLADHMISEVMGLRDQMNQRDLCTQAALFDLMCRSLKIPRSGMDYLVCLARGEVLVNGPHAEIVDREVRRRVRSILNFWDAVQGNVEPFNPYSDPDSV